MKALLLIKIYSICQLVIIILTCAYFLGIFWHIITKDCIQWDQENLYDVYEGYGYFFTNEDYGFQYNSNGEPPSSMESLIKVWYYGITTLSTIGYGDFLPKSVSEKIIIAFVMMFGVSVFSYIMGNFIEILMGYRQLENNGDHRNLTKWVALLTKYNDNMPLPKNLITQIEDFFDYYWYNNPLAAFVTESDIRFISELPESTVAQIYIDYLFKDFLYKYKSYILGTMSVNVEQLSEEHSAKTRIFLVKFVRCLEPRRYINTIILDQFEEVYEVLYVNKGSVIIGYRLFNDIFYAKNMKGNQVVIGDFACLSNKVSEFLYKSHETILGFAIKKERFLEIIEDNDAENMIERLKMQYQENVRTVV